MGPAPGYEAAIGSAAVFDRSRRGKIAVAGNDRLTYLHAMLTNDIASLAAGTGCYATYLTQQGRMIADMRVLEVGDMTLLDLHEDVAAVVLQKLDQFVFSEDVRLGDLGETFAKLCVAGPAAAQVVATVIGPASGLFEADLAAWPEFRNARASVASQVVLVAATREPGLRGFDLYIERPHAELLHAALVNAGAGVGDDATFEVLRIEGGRPAFGVDMEADTIPLEAGIEDRAISFTKGCYPGQEVVIRVVHRGGGRIARRIAGVRVSGEAVPVRGDIVRSGEREAGRVTSAAWSPRANGVIALAMLHRDFQAPGTALTIDHDGEQLAGAIAALPFVAE